MRMTMRQTDLLHGLQTVSRAIPTRTPKPILYGVKIEARKESVSFTAYDLEIGIETVVQQDPGEPDRIQVETPGSLVLQARYLLDIVRKLPGETVRIEVQELVATVSSGTATFTLNGMDPREFPPLPQVYDDRGLAMPASLLRGLIDRTAYASAISEARPILTGVLWTYDDGRLTLTATDSHRLSTSYALVETHRDYALMDSIVPSRSLTELGRILPDNETLSDIRLESNQLLVSTGPTRFFSRLIEGKYPDTSRIIPTSARTSLTLRVKDLFESVERAALLARDVENHVAEFRISAELIEISSRSPEIGTIRETIVPVTFSGDDMALACNVRFLLDALKTVSSESVQIDFTGPGSAFVLRPLEDNSHLQLILPVRIVNV